MCSVADGGSGYDPFSKRGSVESISSSATSFAVKYGHLHTRFGRRGSVASVASSGASTPRQHRGSTGRRGSVATVSSSSTGSSAASSAGRRGSLASLSSAATSMSSASTVVISAERADEGDVKMPNPNRKGKKDAEDYADGTSISGLFMPAHTHSQPKTHDMPEAARESGSAAFVAPAAALGRVRAVPNGASACGRIGWLPPVEKRRGSAADVHMLLAECFDAQSAGRSRSPTSNNAAAAAAAAGDEDGCDDARPRRHSVGHVSECGDMSKLMSKRESPFCSPRPGRLQIVITAASSTASSTPKTHSRSELNSPTSSKDSRRPDALTEVPRESFSFAVGSKSPPAKGRFHEGEVSSEGTPCRNCTEG